MADEVDTARMRSRRATDSSSDARARGRARPTARARARVGCCFGARDAASDDEDARRDASDGSTSASDADAGRTSDGTRARATSAASASASTSASAGEAKARRQSVDYALRASQGSLASGEEATANANGGDDEFVGDAGSAELTYFVKLNAKMLAKRRRATKSELEPLCEALSQTFTFSELGANVRRRVASEMFFINVPEGTILMEEDEPGDALYLVAGGEFDVLQNRLGADISVLTRTKGDIIGELALLYSVPRSATVRAKTRSQVWVCTQQVFKREVKHSVEATTLAKNLFLEQVPVLSALPIDTRKSFADALETVSFDPYTDVITEGEACDGKFYLVNSGRAQVSKLDPDTGEPRTVNHLFRHDFFGASEIIRGDEPREYTVRCVETPLVCYVVNRDVFLEKLSSVREDLLREKSREVIRNRMRQLKGEKSWRSARIRLLGSARVGGKKVNISMYGSVNPRSFATDVNRELGSIDLVEKEILGGGTGGQVYRVIQEGMNVSSPRAFALKRVRKRAVMESPSHIFCEKEVTSEISHFSLMCQHASFQDRNHLYMLFDIMDGCDLMDMLASAVQVKLIPTQIDGEIRHVPTQIGISEDTARYYTAMVILAFEYLHGNQIIYRDLKPENVLLALNGKCKLGDFGYAKKLDVGERAFTFCGTPGYVAPEIVLSTGYGYAVDWWALGVLTYVTITGQQPFTISKDPSQKDDPLKVMRRIVDMSYEVQYPTYATDEACNFISQLLQRNSAKRLGNMQGGVSQIKRHPWFAKFDWALLESGEYTPKPLTLSRQFLEIQRERLIEIERESLLATEMDSARGPTDASMNRANEIFKDF